MTAQAAAMSPMIRPGRLFGRTLRDRLVRDLAASAQHEEPVRDGDDVGRPVADEASMVTVATIRRWLRIGSEASALRSRGEVRPGVGPGGVRGRPFQSASR
jgi:hypothetical protein